MTSSHESSLRSEIRLEARGRAGISSLCSSTRGVAKPIGLMIGLASHSSSSSSICFKTDRRGGDDLALGKDFAWRTEDVGLVGRTIDVAIELLFPSDDSSSSGTPASSVLISEKGGGLIECAVSSGVVTACGNEES